MYSEIEPLLENKKISDEKIDYVDTNGLSKYSDEYFAMTYIDLRKLYNCNLCNKVFNPDMVFGQRIKGLCYHCLISNINKNELDKNKELLFVYISKCYQEHESLDCNKNNCVLCDYKNGILKIPTKKLIFKIYL